MKEEFKKELRELLEKYDAFLRVGQLEDGTYGDIVVVFAVSDSKYNQYTEYLSLGNEFE